MKLPIRHALPVLATLSLLAPAPPALAARVGKSAPAFSGKDLDGKTVSLKDFRGRHVVLEWHNKGCPFVVKHYASGNLPALQAKWTAKGVAWLSIISSSSGTEGFCTPDEARADIAATRTAVTAMLLDPDGKIGRAYDAKCTPHMFVIDPKGVLIYNGAIDDHATTDAADIAGSVNYVDQALAEATAGKPVTVASTRPYGCGVKYRKKG